MASGGLEFVRALVIAYIEVMLLVIGGSFELRLCLSICGVMGCIYGFFMAMVVRSETPIGKYLLHVVYANAMLHCTLVELFGIILGVRLLDIYYLSDKLPLTLAAAGVLLLLFENVQDIRRDLACWGMALVNRVRELELELVMALVIVLIELMMLTIVTRCSLPAPLAVVISFCGNCVCTFAIVVAMHRKNLPVGRYLLHIGYAYAMVHFGTLEMFNIGVAEHNKNNDMDIDNFLWSDKLPLLVAVAVVLLLLFEEKTWTRTRLNEMPSTSGWCSSSQEARITGGD